MPRPSLICGRYSALGSTTRRSSPPTTCRSTAVSCARVALGMVSGPLHGYRSPAPSSWLVRNGESTRQSCPTFAAGYAFRCVTTTQDPTRKRARASCSWLKPRGGASRGHLIDLGHGLDLVPDHLRHIRKRDHHPALKLHPIRVGGFRLLRRAHDSRCELVDVPGRPLDRALV